MMPRSPYSPFSLLRLLLEHRRALLGVPFASALVAIAVGLIVGATYRAESSFKPQAESSELARFSGLASQLGINLPGGLGESGESLDFYARLAHSRALLGAVAQREYPLPDGRGTLVTYYDARGGTESQRLLNTVERLGRDIQTHLDASSGVITVRSRAKSAALAEQVNRAILDEVNRFNLEVRQSQASAERQFVEAQVAEAQQELQAAEAELSTFMERNRRYEEWPQLRFEAGRLQRRVELQQQVYTTLVQARERSRLDEVRNTPVITILDPPEGSAKRKRGLLTKAILGAVLGLTVVLTWIFLREYAGRLRREYPEEYAQVRAAAPRIPKVLTVLLLVLSACDVMDAEPVEPRVQALSAGALHTCALTTDARLFCWGDNTSGQLGRGSTQRTGAPATVRGDVAYSAVSAGGRHTCALTPAGEPWCWGANDHGQAGAGVTTERLDVPARVATDARFVALAAGAEHTCALTAAGAAWCWGAGADGRLGTGTVTDARVPLPVQAPTGFSAIAAGGRHTCALTVAGELYCWGANETGQLALGGTGGFSATPRRAATELRFVDVTVGFGHACAIAEGGRVHCWGENARGEVGTYAHVETIPTQMLNEEVYSDVQAGTHLTCGLRPNGEAMCWGRGTAGELGRGQLMDTPWAQLVMHEPGRTFGLGFGSYLAVTVGEAHGCALVGEPRTVCWGVGTAGQLGNGARLSPTPLPVRLSGP